MYAIVYPRFIIWFIIMNHTVITVLIGNDLFIKEHICTYVSFFPIYTNLLIDVCDT